MGDKVSIMGSAVPSTSQHNWDRGAQEVSPYLQHFIPGKAKLLEQQGNVGEIHAHEGAAVWLSLQSPTH